MMMQDMTETTMKRETSRAPTLLSGSKLFIVQCMPSFDDRHLMLNQSVPVF